MTEDGVRDVPENNLKKVLQKFGGFRKLSYLCTVKQDKTINIMEKKEMKRVNYTLCDTTYIPDYSEYVDNCEACDIMPSGEGSNDYWEWVGEIQRDEYDDMMSNLKYSKYNDMPCIIFGSLGLWTGRHEIYPVVCNTLSDAISKSCGECDDVLVKVEDGIVNVCGMHHDGRNYFTIQPLSDKGYERLKWDSDGYLSNEIEDDDLSVYDDYLY